jgi:diguanylate cyclase (GGDEF)-like protein
MPESQENRMIEDKKRPAPIAAERADPGRDPLGAERERSGVRLRTVSLIIVLVALLGAAALFITDSAAATGCRHAAAVLLVLAMLGIAVYIDRRIRLPLDRMVQNIREQKAIPPEGPEELRRVAGTYNAVMQENRDVREKLSHEASHDALTGLFNRSAYELLLESADKEHMALLVVDVDRFKQINDTYGHDIGDRVLRRVAEILQSSFRSVDIICRIGGDEFVVIMTRVNSGMRQLVSNKIARANGLLQHPEDDLPPVSLSVGVAFSDRKNPKGDFFKDADTAAYSIKRAGGAGCAFFEGDPSD